MMVPGADPAWWRHAVVYQIYPWSFQDSNGDGIGDLPGILSRLDYLNDGTDRSLGVDAIWLSPIYPSPMKDFGYDVADYCDVDPRFGTLADFDRLLAEAHRRGIRVLMDLVLNHTSDQHAWFLESRSSRQSSKRDWYLWADAGPYGRPPSNWVAVFGGSAWEWDRRTNQYYLHSFLKEQPDLNWSHPGVQQAMHDVMRFWLDRGVDGFRLDAINWIGKDDRWPNNPRRFFAVRSYLRRIQRYNRDQPLTHDVLKLLRRWTDAYPGAVMVGEASSDTPGGPAAFYGTGVDQLHLVFNFRLLKSAWDPVVFRRLIREWDEAVPAGGWPTQVLSNHDQSRHATRYGRGVDPETADRRARAAAVLLLTLRGTPFLYYGEELGMRDGRLRYRDVRDPYTRRYWLFQHGRDPARTPMQWDASPHAGFTTGRPWLPVSPDYVTVNAAAAADDPASVFSLYRRLIRIRRSSVALTSGRYREVTGGPLACLIYVREVSGPPAESVLIAVNFSSRPQTLTSAEVKGRGEVLLSTGTRAAGARFDPTSEVLGPDEAIIVRLEPS
ncbi:glycoside hydrolase family 13 protein [Candidatus Nitrospira bockiana]